MVRRYLRGRDAVVLNIGCGVGRVERYLAPHVAELHAVDISGEMIARARERLAGFPNVHLREIGNDEFLIGFEAERFDLVFSFLVLQHLDREDAFLYLRDAYRILKPGGVLFLQFPNFLSPEYTPRLPAKASTSRARSPGRVRFYTETEVRHLLALLGFEVAELWLASGERGDTEIYVAARKRDYIRIDIVSADRRRSDTTRQPVADAPEVLPARRPERVLRAHVRQRGEPRHPRRRS